LLSEVSLLGIRKAKAAAGRIVRANPNVTMEAVTEFLTEANADCLAADCDVALDALDKIPSRRILAAACERSGIPCVKSFWLAARWKPSPFIITTCRTISMV